jgi:hypothetical protein
MSDFIEIYDKALTNDECDLILDRMHKMREYWVPAMTGPETVDKDQKDGWDLGRSFCHSGEGMDREIAEPIIRSLFKYSEIYCEKYQTLKYVPLFGIWDVFNLQMFPTGGGYKAPHCEHGNEGYKEKRVLVWMFYLNNAKSGTRFLHQRRVVKAKKGRLVIWPASVTHVHSGVIPNLNDKYIATGWYNYQDDDKPEDESVILF